MRTRTVLVLAPMIMLVVGLAHAKSTKASVPAIFGTAKYVYVKAEGGDLYDPRLLPEDRNAISDVMNALRAWGRYTVMPTAEGAELVFIVRKGRLGSVDMGGRVGATTTPPNGSPRQLPGEASGVSMDDEVGPPDDFLEVRMRQPDGDLSGPIWEHSESGGLDTPDVALLDRLKRAVEKDYPQK